MKKLLILPLLCAALLGVAQVKSKIDTPIYSRYFMADTSIKYRMFPTYSYSGFNYRADNKVIINISAPDSTNTVTVHLSKKDITFINDSTFTFKQSNIRN